MHIISGNLLSTLWAAWPHWHVHKSQGATAMFTLPMSDQLRALVIVYRGFSADR